MSRFLDIYEMDSTRIPVSTVYLIERISRSSISPAEVDQKVSIINSVLPIDVSPSIQANTPRESSFVIGVRAHKSLSPTYLGSRRSNYSSDLVNYL